MSAQQVDHWFRSNPQQQDVKIGSVFRSIRKGNITEIAKVLDVAPDSVGVPHVRFKVLIRSGHNDCLEELRTLGLASFAERFSTAI